MSTREPKPPRKAPTTRWGRFLVAERLKRGWFQKDAFDHFRDRFNWAEDSRASYGNWERGTAEPSGEVARAILTEYGYDELPPEEAPAEVAAESSLIAALAAQTKAISDLAAQVKALVEAQTSDEASHALGVAVALAVREALQGVGRVAETPQL